MTATPPTSVWPILTYRDARGALDFLAEAFGFEPTAVYARDDDASVIEHAEMRWPRGGRIMFGTAGKDDGPFGARTPGNDCVYIVCDDPDALSARATAAGATVVRGLVDEGYGSRGFTVADPEGNLFSFGTYAGERGVNSDLREEFGALMDAWSAAIVADDADAIGRFAEPDWVLIGETGVFPREQFLDLVATGRITHHTMSHEIHHVRTFGRCRRRPDPRPQQRCLRGSGVRARRVDHRGLRPPPRRLEVQHHASDIRCRRDNPIGHHHDRSHARRWALRPSVIDLGPVLTALTTPTSTTPAGSPALAGRLLLRALFWHWGTRLKRIFTTPPLRAALLELCRCNRRSGCGTPPPPTGVAREHLHLAGCRQAHRSGDRG